ncbi:hypothetical protein P153DRAFT_394708 [Dothidotthia symphoricarpi CBS 119687]|uniref:Dolichyl-diphosphooligosaccharide--protein glycosyltransferase subunit 4 n=1 Tax=Dothidotthia symphoricarpi CBS 119687 TaxID=1392245 RepID=A0A6A6AJG5_9PLEO|nr:uncharacterized protein P153DRAFT_394708 [Dothidotthia symphoricarpi CBS 119687]KAF2131363.1 hypothetical protein P153DRAFT_394708 [Dothidotthia symphoricarpi CBS 119687]
MDLNLCARASGASSTSEAQGGLDNALPRSPEATPRLALCSSRMSMSTSLSPIVPLTFPQQASNPSNLHPPHPHHRRAAAPKMITDAQLYSLAIFLGSAAMMLIVLYHFLEVNSEEHAAAQKPKAAAKKVKI